MFEKLFRTDLIYVIMFIISLIFLYFSLITA
ncbi:hypothetical protein HNQ35_001145 [Cerasibacillus quisquiliarum]|nr:hypothetical protein [Cerasibacillus quisquiliarum]